jgi:predicted nuclease with TOPRIM domain
MFNKKKIEELQASIKSLSNKISELESKSEQVSELQTQFDNILAKLDSESFSKDWKEYLKWKEMKDQLPDIEEMYNLKTLKRLISERDEHDKVYKAFLVDYSKWNAITGPYQPVVNQAHRKNALEMLNLFQSKVQTTEKEIHQYLEKIGQQKNKKELIGILKLYGISTDWIKP